MHRRKFIGQSVSGVALYFDSMGRRSMNHYNKFYRNIPLGDSAPEISYPMYLSMLGYPPENQPALEQHEKSDTAFSADYVYRECRRAVQAVNGGARVYSRPGSDMPYTIISHPCEEPEISLRYEYFNETR